MPKVRIFLTGVGGQGTLTATIMLARAAMDKGLAVTAGEVHGMAQRGGVVESTLLIGGFKSPRIATGEAAILLGFAALETLRALPYLAPGGVVISNSESIPAIGVTMGRENRPRAGRNPRPGGRLRRAQRVPALPDPGHEGRSPAMRQLALLGALCATGPCP
jgi:indolepyruvate ferredoxin oxidoreductase beta subunit